MKKFDFISNKSATTVGVFKQTKYYKGVRLLLVSIYGLIEENEAKLFLEISTPCYHIPILQYLYGKKMLNYGEIIMRHIKIFMEIHQKIFSHNNMTMII